MILEEYKGKELEMFIEACERNGIDMSKQIVPKRNAATIQSNPNKSTSVRSLSANADLMCEVGKV